LFFLLGLIASLLLAAILLDLIQSQILAVVGVGLILTDPAYFFYQHFYFYPFILQSLLIAFLFTTIKVLRVGHQGALLVAAIILGSIPNARSLYHPIWAVSVYVFLLVMLRKIHGAKESFTIRKFAFSTVVLGILLLSWPLKNYVLFDQFTFSTWEGFNMGVGWLDLAVLDKYRGSGSVPENIQQDILTFQQRHGFSETEMLVLAAPEKSSGVRNWNHYIFSQYNGPLRKEAILARVRDPARWLRTTITYYLAWTRASYVDPYGDQIRGPDKEQYLAYATFHRKLFYNDLRSIVNSLLSIDVRFYIREQTLLPLTMFGVFVFPLLLLISPIFAIWKLRKGLLVDFAIINIMWFTVLWVLLIPILTDGNEGNRMRFSITPFLVILALMLLKEGVRLIGRNLTWASGNPSGSIMNQAEK
jgi:hypothetical protein